MTKQEKIQEEWIKLIGVTSWYIHKHQIDNNGYIQYTKPRNLSVLEDLCEKHPSRIDWEKWRPLSLKGIETNNNWIKIESEEDLPKDDDFKFNETFLVYYYCEGYCNAIFSGSIERYTLSFRNIKYNLVKEKVTHYQPIQKPPLPIY